MNSSATPPIKLLFVLPTLNGGGAERVVLNLLRHLNTTRYVVTLLLLKREGVYWEEVPNSVKLVCATEHGHRYLTFPRALATMIAEARKHDVVIAGLELLPTYLAYIAGAITRRPVIGWVHIDMVTYLPRLKTIHRVLVRTIYPKLNGIVCVSQGAMRAMCSLLPARKIGICRAIYNINDVSLQQSHSSVHLAVPISNITPWVVGIGRLMEQKGFDILIMAHAELIRTGVKHDLLILGDGLLRKDLLDLAYRLGVANTVHLPGFVPNIHDYLKKARLFVLPSRFEGLGMVLLEAMSVGVPVVAADCPSGPAEILAQGEYGMLTPPDDPHALAAAIRNLLTSPDERSHYSSKGLERVRDFSPEVIVPLWEDLFSVTMNGRR